MIFNESKLAHKYLDGLKGLEIGGSAHNPFGLNTKNVDCHASMDTIFKQQEIHLCGEALPIDILSQGDDLPVGIESQDFIVSSHVIEHFFDPIKAIKEWLRVVKSGGYVFIIAPHKERTFDSPRPRTTLEELVGRHCGTILEPEVDVEMHWSVWITQDLLDLCEYMGWKVVDSMDQDDKVGNGFTVVIQKK